MMMMKMIVFPAICNYLTRRPVAISFKRKRSSESLALEEKKKKKNLTGVVAPCEILVMIS